MARRSGSAPPARGAETEAADGDQLVETFLFGRIGPEVDRTFGRRFGALTRLSDCLAGIIMNWKPAAHLGNVAIIEMNGTVEEHPSLACAGIDLEDHMFVLGIGASDGAGVDPESAGGRRRLRIGGLLGRTEQAAKNQRD